MCVNFKDIFIKNITIPNGICSFDSFSNYLINCRAKSKLPTNAKSIIAFLFPYKLNYVKRNISQYAIFPDYHKIVMQILEIYCGELKKLFSKYSFIAFCDNSPIPEVKMAYECGLGVIGKNGLLINNIYGSFVFIGEIVTDMDLKEYYSTNLGSSCLNCNNCVYSCPGLAISDGKINKNICASNISQKNGILNKIEEQILIKSNSVWGCDICQDICPMNDNVPFTNIEEFKSNIVPIIKLGDYHKLSDRAFQWRKACVIERNIKLLSGGRTNYETKDS